MNAESSLGLASAKPRPTSLGIAHGIFAIVLVLRLIALVRLGASPFALPGTGDMHFYHEWARSIQHGQLTDHLAFYGLPLYAYFLAGIYSLFGTSPFTPALLQICCDAGTATLLYQIAVHVFPEERMLPRDRLGRGRSIGVIAAAGWAFFVPAQTYSIILMPTAFAIFVFWFVVWKIVERDETPRLLMCILLGLLVGFTAMAVATVLFATVLLVGAIWLKPSESAQRSVNWRKRFAASLLVVVGVMVGTAPCWIHNRFIAHDPVFLSAHSGINFWIGNNPEATGYPHFPGMHSDQASLLKDSIELAEQAAGRPLPRSAVSAYWNGKADNYIAQSFGQWLQLLSRKVRNFWNAFEYDDISMIAQLRGSGIIFPGVRFGLVAALGLPGVCVAMKRSSGSRWIAAAIGLAMIAVLPVFVTERYRILAVPGLLSFGAAMIWFVWDDLMHGRTARSLIAVGVIAISALIVSWPQSDPALWALAPYNAGTEALERHDFTTAREQLMKAYSFVPRSAVITFALGNLRWEEHNPNAAKEFYVATLAADSHHKGALNNLGVIALATGDAFEASKYFRRAVIEEANNPKSHYLLAKALAATGDRAGAKAESERAVELDPQQHEYLTLRDELTKP